MKIPSTLKLIRISTIVLSLTILFSANLAIGAEGVNVPLKKAPVISGKTGGASKIAKNYNQKQKVSSEAPVKATKQEQNVEKAQSPFVKSLFKMFEALFAVLAIIAGLSGIVLFYKWFKSKTALVVAQQQTVQTITETKEPETVSEAVASFVKHRIKK